MIVLCVDPGLANVGWAVMVVDMPTRVRPAIAPSFTAAGVLRTRALNKAKREEMKITKIADKARRVHEIAGFLDGLCRELAPSVLVHEAQSLGFHQSLTLFDMGLAFGAMLGVAKVHGLEVISASPREIKMRCCANPKAEKVDVIEWARSTFPSVEWPRATAIHEHQADAMAAGYTLADTLRSRMQRAAALTGANPLG